MSEAIPPIDDEAFAAAILDRPLVQFPGEALRGIVGGRRVLVTGAGGFIGAGLVRRIAALGPARIVLVENGEFALYSIDSELAAHHPDLPRRAVYCDIRDRVAVARCFAEERPEIVFHAAALKQLPLMEAHPREAVLTNTLGARNVADAASAARSLAMVLISTDKAVHASSVLGVSKRLAEAYCQAVDIEADAPRFVAVRFGNVFGSTGSVVPLFRRQIEAGGPVTLTDPRMTRYFMTLAEASGLVLCASALALADGEARGRVYLLETGGPVRIADIARRMILNSGRDPREIAMVATGMRPGERLSERLVHVAEQADPTPVAGVTRLSPRSWALPIIRQQLAALEQACRDGNDERLCRLIGRYIPEFAAPGAVPAEAAVASGEG